MSTISRIKGRNRLRKLSNSLYIQFSKAYVNIDSNTLFNTIINNELVPNLIVIRKLMSEYSLNLKDLNSTVFKYFLIDCNLLHSFEDSKEVNLDLNQFSRIKKDFICTISSIFNLQLMYSEEKLAHVISTLFKFYRGF